MKSNIIADCAGHNTRLKYEARYHCDLIYGTSYDLTDEAKWSIPFHNSPNLNERNRPGHFAFKHAAMRSGHITLKNAAMRAELDCIDNCDYIYYLNLDRLIYMINSSKYNKERKQEKKSWLLKILEMILQKRW